jgi:endonuclease-3
MHAGASGYVLKSSTKEELLRAIRAIRQGAGFLQAEVTKPLLRAWLSMPSSTREKQPDVAEIQILELLSEGKITKETAALLSISDETVKTHLKRLYDKLGARPRASGGDRAATEPDRVIDDSNIDRALAELKRAVRRWRVPVVGHYRHKPYETLISCLLSLRTKDETTEGASARLFALARSPRAMLKLPQRKIARAIYPVGFYRTKARTILQLSRTLVERHEGAVPDTLTSCSRSPVWAATPQPVLTLAFGNTASAWTPTCTASATAGIRARPQSGRDRDALARATAAPPLAKLQRPARRVGQNLCHPTSPWCSRCPLERLCGRVGVTRSR